MGICIVGGIFCILFGLNILKSGNDYPQYSFFISFVGISLCTLGIIIIIVGFVFDITKRNKKDIKKEESFTKNFVNEQNFDNEREVTAEEFKKEVLLEYPSKIEIIDCHKSKRTYDIIGFSDNTELISSYVNNTSVIEEDYDFIFISNEKIYYNKDIDKNDFDSLDSFHPMYFCKDTKDGIKFTMKPVGIQKYTCQFIKIKQSKLPNQTLGMSYIAEYDSLVKLGYVLKKSHYTIIE